jgi:alkanesulfonate monooxygenase SsuD/methylene tetrahydromethanopterin reductase-like flavin-dependent oxidoreductase (luciferase family)
MNGRGSIVKWGVIYNGDALTINDMQSFAARAEQAGADSVWTAEGWRDAFVPLAAINGAVNRVRIGTAIAQMARPPVLTTLSALSMAEYSRGRFVLGVGTGPRDWNNNWHGFDVPRPVTQIREYIQCLRELLKATQASPVTFKGTYYKVSGYMPFLPAPITVIPIYLAGVNRRMIGLAGSNADGLILGPLNSIPYLKETVHPNLQKRANFDLCLPRICAVNADAAAARNLARHAIAFYCLLSYYDVVLTPLGFSPQATAVRDAFGRGDIPAMFRAITDDMVAALAFAGTKDEVRKQARDFDGLIDTLILYSPYFGVSRDETIANHGAMLDAFAD